MNKEETWIELCKIRKDFMNLPVNVLYNKMLEIEPAVLKHLEKEEVIIFQMSLSLLKIGYDKEKKEMRFN